MVRTETALLVTGAVNLLLTRALDEKLKDSDLRREKSEQVVVSVRGSTNRLGLPDAVRSRDSLQIHLRVEVLVVTANMRSEQSVCSRVSVSRT